MPKQHVKLQSLLPVLEKQRKYKVSQVNKHYVLQSHVLSTYRRHIKYLKSTSCLLTHRAHSKLFIYRLLKSKNFCVLSCSRVKK